MTIVNGGLSVMMMWMVAMVMVRMMIIIMINYLK